MSKSETLKTEPRTKLGSRSARKLRDAARIPASMAGDGKTPHVDFSIDEHAFLAARRHHVHLFDLELGGTTQSAVVRELAWDTFGDWILHIDFKRVRRDVKTEAEVELEFAGHPKGGMLNHLLTHVTVICFPQDIPDMIEVPVGHLETGGAILARELVMPAGVELGLPPETMIANVVVQKIEVAAPAPGTEPAAGATPTTPAPGGAAPTA